jgi:hypothetical protein
VPTRSKEQHIDEHTGVMMFCQHVATYVMRNSAGHAKDWIGAGEKI